MLLYFVTRIARNRVASDDTEELFEEMAMNLSQIHDPRCWQKWDRSGALTYMTPEMFEAARRAVEQAEFRAHTNPERWRYRGAYTVELMPNANKSIAPSSTRIRGNLVRVSDGEVYQSMGGIQMMSQGQPFYWGYPFIKVIRTNTGRIIWVNYNYR